MAEEVDSGEVEGKTKMAFAKMQIPPNLKSSYLLNDADFVLKNDDTEEEPIIEQNVKTDANSDNYDNIDNELAKSLPSSAEKKSSPSRPITPLDNTDSPNTTNKKGLTKHDKEFNSPDGNSKTGRRKSMKKKDNESNLSMKEQAARLGLYA